MNARWNPYREMRTMRHAMDRMMENRLSEAPAARDWGLALDVVEDDDAYVVKASVPGIKAEDIDITFDKGVLTIKGEIKSEQETEHDRYHLRERRYGSFARSIALPTIVQAEQIEASASDGVLTLRLPKAEELKPKRIAVQAAPKTIEPHAN